MTKLTVTVGREHRGAGGRYVADLAPGSEAEMTYRMAEQDVMVIDHTGVPPAFRGRDVALQLVEAAIADARREGFRIVPRCSYVAAQFRRHPEWADLLAQ